MKLFATYEDFRFYEFTDNVFKPSQIIEFINQSL